MKKKTANILFAISLTGIAGGLVGTAYNLVTAGSIRNTETMRLEERVSSLEDELKGNYKFKFDGLKSQERYHKALQQEYEALKPAYEKTQPEIKSALEDIDKHEKYGFCCFGAAGISVIIGLIAARKPEED